MPTRQSIALAAAALAVGGNTRQLAVSRSGGEARQDYDARRAREDRRIGDLQAKVARADRALADAEHRRALKVVKAKGTVQRIAAEHEFMCTLYRVGKIDTAIGYGPTKQSAQKACAADLVHIRHQELDALAGAPPAGSDDDEHYTPIAMLPPRDEPAELQERDPSGAIALLQQAKDRGAEATVAKVGWNCPTCGATGEMAIDMTQSVTSESVLAQLETEHHRASPGCEWTLGRGLDALAEQVAAREPAEPVTKADPTEALELTGHFEQRTDEEKGSQPCPNDTDGDGNCGQPLCPHCGIVPDDEPLDDEQEEERPQYDPKWDYDPSIEGER